MIGWFEAPPDLASTLEEVTVWALANPAESFARGASLPIPQSETAAPEPNWLRIWLLLSALIGVSAAVTRRTRLRY